MTVRYNQEVATVRCGGFLRLLLKWEGSVYKLIWFELAIFIGIYAILSLCYHFVMNAQHKRSFENVAQYCSKHSDLIPIAFVLGFYVQRVITRFWEQFFCIPWPNRMAFYVTTYIQCNEERGRMMRRTIMRYLFLTFVMTMSSISPQIKKRFPTLTHMREAGFLMLNEQQILESMKTTINKYFVPITWATAIVASAKKEGKIKSDIAVQRLVSEINDFRGGCGMLFTYDWVSIPLGYTQVATLAVYIFSLCCLLGRFQFEVENPTEMHFPFFTILQFVFYMGWLKVAECGLSPYGEDDDDFDINLLVDRYLHESYIVVDELYMKSPDMSRDKYWGLVDFDIPYTSAAVGHKRASTLGSATGVIIPVEKQSIVTLSSSSRVDSLQTPSISTGVISTSSLRSSRRKSKRRLTLLDASTIIESLPIPGGVSSVRFIEPIGRSAIEEELSSLSTVVELNPNTLAGEQPSASAEQQSNTTSAVQQPFTSAEQQSSTSDEQKPSSSDEQQPGTPVEPQPSRATLAEEPSVIITQKESNLMAMIQSELKELRESSHRSLWRAPTGGTNL